MKYYKVTLENGDTLYHESKQTLDQEELVEAMLEQASLSPAETDDITDIQEIDEEEYEESVI